MVFFYSGKKLIWQKSSNVKKDLSLAMGKSLSLELLLEMFIFYILSKLRDKNCIQMAKIFFHLKIAIFAISTFASVEKDHSGDADFILSNIYKTFFVGSILQ